MHTWLCDCVVVCCAISNEHNLFFVSILALILSSSCWLVKFSARDYVVYVMEFGNCMSRGVTICLGRAESKTDST